MLISTSSSGLLLYAALVDLLAEDFLSEEANRTLTSKDKKLAFMFVLLGGKQFCAFKFAWGSVDLELQPPPCLLLAHSPKRRPRRRHEPISPQLRGAPTQKPSKRPPRGYRNRVVLGHESEHHSSLLGSSFIICRSRPLARQHQEKEGEEIVFVCEAGEVRRKNEKGIIEGRTRGLGDQDKPHFQMPGLLFVHTTRSLI